MNNKVLHIISIFIIAIVFIACENSDDDSTPKPVVTIMELGEGDSHGNDHTAKVGDDVHIEVDIVAEGKIDYIQIKIHPEGEHHDEEAHHEKEGDHDEWELDTIFSGEGITGKKNTIFHEHVEIDSTAAPGEYHFDFIVTDMEGNEGSAESELLIEE